MTKLPFYELNFRATQDSEAHLQSGQHWYVSPMQNITAIHLGPLLCLIYINDLVKAAPIIQYADDTNIFSTNPKILQNEI